MNPSSTAYSQKFVAVPLQTASNVRSVANKLSDGIVPLTHVFVIVDSFSIRSQ